MFLLRITFVFVLWSALSPAAAQAVQRKHLVMTVAGGGGALAISSDIPELKDPGTTSGALRCAFGYAINDRWSLGFHYDRVGTTRHAGVLDRLHITTYMIEGSYRPWTGERAALECGLGFGLSTAALFPNAGRLPLTGSGGAITVGVRYYHMITGILGAMVAVDHLAGSAETLVLEGGVVGPDGTGKGVRWNSQRITAGLMVRF